MNFSIQYVSGEHIWSSIYIYKNQSFTFSMLIELGYKRAAKTDIRIMCNESCVKTEHK